MILTRLEAGRVAQCLRSCGETQLAERVDAVVRSQSGWPGGRLALLHLDRRTLALLRGGLAGATVQLVDAAFSDVAQLLVTPAAPLLVD